MFARNTTRLLLKNGVQASNAFRQVPAAATGSRNFATLILAEHFEGNLNSSVGSCLKAAQELNDPEVSKN